MKEKTYKDVIAEGRLASCTEECRKPVQCVVCRRYKAILGRDIPAAASNGYCHYLQCPGYMQDPPARQHLWPNEWIPADGPQSK
jgi:hypothetical protein